VFLIFLSIALLHYYWSFGGQWGKWAAIPTRNDGTHVIRPGFLSTLIVALSLSAFAVFSLTEIRILDLPIAPVVKRFGFWTIAVIFSARAVGDLKYFGFLKKIRNTQFARRDTKFYSPVCVLIGILNVFLAVST
ncbi:MAG TPA: DUF3995 domain-containing protein, partial [Chitinophagaceae bacterium]|nr:DUF3995 domain-containing protein [Chitinophagaceae bacterium]